MAADVATPDLNECPPYLSGASPQGLGDAVDFDEGSTISICKRTRHMGKLRHKGRLKPKPLRKYEPKRRNCLLCHEPFMSDWPGQRICPRCKSLVEWR